MAWGFFALGIACLGLVGGMIYAGKPYAIPHVVYVEKPIPHFFCGMAALLAWHVLWRGYRYSGREWGAFAGKCALLTVSIAIALAGGEKFYRGYSKWKQEQNSLNRLRNLRKKGQPIQVYSSHALASIIAPSDDLKVVYSLQPHLDMQFGHRSLRTNADGMREDRDYPVDRQPNSVRIVGLGDSGIFGWNVEQGENYLDVLEQILNTRSNGVTYEALNMGVPGYNTRLEFESLRAKGLRYTPDVVIVGWCGNDYGLPFFLWEKERYDQSGSMIYKLFFARTNMPSDAGFRFRDQRNVDINHPEGVVPEALSGVDVKGVTEALKDFKKLSETQPFHLLVFGPMDERVMGICRELGIEYCNTYEHIAPDRYPPEWAVHFMHPRAQGHRVLAEHLEQELEKRGWLAPPP